MSSNSSPRKQILRQNFLSHLHLKGNQRSSKHLIRQQKKPVQDEDASPQQAQGDLQSAEQGGQPKEHKSQ